MATVQGVGRSGGVRVTTNNGIVRVEETFQYIVYADSRFEQYIDVANAPGLPIVGVSVATGGTTICKTLSGSQREANPTIWDFTANFSSEVEQNTQLPDTEPTEWVPVYETRYERIEEPATQDKNGDPIVNSAGQDLPTGLITTRSIPVWTFSQFEPASVSDETIIDRNEKINSAEFRGRAAETLLLVVESSVLGFYYGQARRFTTYSLKYDSTKWTEKRLDVGDRYLDGGTLTRYVKDGEVIMGNLDGSGGQVADGDPPAVLEFDIYDQIDFNEFLRF